MIGFQEAAFAANLAIAAVLIATNWLTFVWAVNNDHKIDASLGYFICPQVIVLLGVIFLRERLSLIQWGAFALVGIGVFRIAQSGDSVPWGGLIVAFSFGFYGLSKKLAPVSSFVRLTFVRNGVLAVACDWIHFCVGRSDPVHAGGSGARSIVGEG